MFAFPDIAIPVSIFLIVYIGYMLFYVFYSVFNVYHLIRYGVSGYGLYAIVTVFTGGTILLIAASVIMILGIDWTYAVSLDSAANYYNEDLFPGL